jgi:hypothetical protein
MKTYRNRAKILVALALSAALAGCTHHHRTREVSLDDQRHPTTRTADLSQDRHAWVVQDAEQQSRGTHADGSC